MNTYIVFGSRNRPVFGGGSFLDWSEPPIGVYEAESPDDACKAAAADSGYMGTFVAVECYVWGIEMMPTTARKIGSRASVEERIADRLDRIEKLEAARRLVEAASADEEDDNG